MNKITKIFPSRKDVVFTSLVSLLPFVINILPVDEFGTFDIPSYILFFLIGNAVVWIESLSKYIIIDSVNKTISFKTFFTHEVYDWNSIQEVIYSDSTDFGHHLIKSDRGVIKLRVRDYEQERLLLIEEILR